MLQWYYQSINAHSSRNKYPMYDRNYNPFKDYHRHTHYHFDIGKTAIWVIFIAEIVIGSIMLYNLTK